MQFSNAPAGIYCSLGLLNPMYVWCTIMESTLMTFTFTTTHNPTDPHDGRTLKAKAYVLSLYNSLPSALNPHRSCSLGINSVDDLRHEIDM